MKFSLRRNGAETKPPECKASRTPSILKDLVSVTKADISELQNAPGCKYLPLPSNTGNDCPIADGRFGIYLSLSSVSRG